MTIFFTKLDRDKIEVRRIPKMGRAAVDSNAIFIDDFFIPDEDRIGEEGKGFHYLLHSLNPERIIVAAGAIGIAQDSLRRAADYARERVVFGRPIGQNQSIQHPLAEVWCDIEAAWLMTMKAATLYDSDQSCGSYANAAKLMGGRIAFKACHASRADAWRHGICEGISSRTPVPRIHPAAARAHQRAAHSLVPRREGTGNAEILLTEPHRMSDIGIKSFAAYIPRLRMDRASIAAAHAWALPGLKGAGKGERSFCSWDEDSITMSVDAVRACLRSSAGGAVRALTFASTTPVFSDLQNASMVAAASGLGSDLSTLDTAGSLRAGTSALLRALESAQGGDAVVVAADGRHGKPGSLQEMQYGAGSIALRIGAGDVIAKYLGGASSASQFVDHFRAEGEQYDYQWEERWVRDEGYLKIVPEAVGRLFKATGVSNASAIDFFCLPATISGIAAAVAKKLKIKPEAVVDNLAARCGDTGVAHPLMMLGLALETAKPGQKILLVGFGAGCDALLFEATDAISGFRSACSVSQRIARGRHREELQQTAVLRWRARARLGHALRDRCKDGADPAVPFARPGHLLHRWQVRRLRCDPVPASCRPACAAARRRRCSLRRWPTSLPKSRRTPPTG